MIMELASLQYRSILAIAMQIWTKKKLKQNKYGTPQISKVILRKIYSFISLGMPPGENKTTFNFHVIVSSPVLLFFYRILFCETYKTAINLSFDG